MPVKTVDLPSKEIARAAMASINALFSGELDPWRPMWDRIGNPQRTVLVRMAGRPGFYADREWIDLAGEVRADIKRAARTMREFLNGLPQ